MTVAAGRCLQVFARVPAAGRVKTRLIPALGADGAATIYRRLLAGTLDTAAATPVERLQVWLDAADGGTAPLRRAAPAAGLYHQQGADLGARMADAMGHGLAAAERVVLIGSDCPDVTVDYLNTAFAALDAHDAVIGPAADGGYVLIGLRRLDPHLFEAIPWSTAGVLAATRARLRALGWRWQELAVLRDVDEFEDLAAFPALWPGARDGLR